MVEEKKDNNTWLVCEGKVMNGPILKEDSSVKAVKAVIIACLQVHRTQ